MNSRKSSSLPLVCRLTRFRASWTDSETSTVGNHCATCADCRHYFEAANQLENSLRRDAVRMGTLPTRNLENRILNTVQRSQREKLRPQRQFSWGIAVLAAAAVAIIASLRIQNTAPAHQPEPTASIQDALVVANELPRQWMQTLQPGAVKLLEDNPLQSEIASVSSDARSALNFLVLNFLPSDTTLASEPRPVSQPHRSS